MARQGFEWAIQKGGLPPEMKRGGKTEYAEHERAANSYAHYISGYTEEEVAAFLGCTVQDVALDIQHIKSLHPVRTILQHENDRLRIMIQRAEGKNYSRLINEALSLTAKEYLIAGQSPVGALKEFREVVGLVQRPAPFIEVNTATQVNIGSNPTSSEDILRRVMARMEERNTKAITATATTVSEDEADPPQEAIPEED